MNPKDRSEHQDPLAADTPPAPVAPRTKARRGFAAIDRKRLSEIASKGGKAAHAAGTAHKFTSEEARVAGRKGGHQSHARRRERLEQRPNDAPPASDATGNAKKSQ